MYTLKKSLGQHFLKDEGISQRIVEALKARPFGRLLEVGPGGGALTKYLLQLPDVDFKAVELDEEKAVYLENTYPAIRGKLIRGSILDIPAPWEGPFTVVGNFPYNISSQILFRVLDWKDQTETVVGMFQKEVAQRVAAKEGSKTYGILSVLVQAFFQVEYLFEVGEQAFTPPPKVKSAVIRLTPRAQIPAFRSEEHLRRLVKTAFNQRRKMLRNAVKGLFPPDVLADPLFDKRAEQLSVEDFAALTKRMS
ncbi:16S rRNA (adenine(1518)-N(6)/adenine(1519)-N(6))-dimethyltransferase RsmA [Dinghuibacter silviterrae]|uniref:Ribosomal RNA small subunit methyltransferase A n=1 Tax=Dinghuibacter silviterrae TaxID=1539049 RepID=A0A4R8DQS6_9BACT|nr:16S rRNA (adenine(1518)-N(6)/adenine(1519)-N(6))-dimethyltransferase RsmA [Dinghuibacter silviterrae]TDX00148.1 16S rRNA (adenine1518-N6/adenine1519-N6)-dimethyltransferase [Dinghuibacter silviterrae]